MGLFKYVTPARIDILRNLEIRFSPPASFNDPFEMKPHVPGFGTEKYYGKTLEPSFATIVEEEYAGLPPHLKVLVTKEQFQAFAETQKSLVFGETKRLAELVLPQVLTALNNLWDRIGILCLSERFDSLLMWAHYTDSHKGFVVELDDQAPFFDQRASSGDELRHLRKVAYSPTRPSTPFAEIESFDVFLTKSSDWEYEQEWRMLLPLDKATRVLPGNPFSMHLFALPASAIKSICLGCRSEPALRSELTELIGSRTALSHVKVYQGFIDEQHYRLNFEIRS